MKNIKYLSIFLSIISCILSESKLYAQNFDFNKVYIRELDEVDPREYDINLNPSKSFYFFKINKIDSQYNSSPNEFFCEVFISNRFFHKEFTKRYSKMSFKDDKNGFYYLGKISNSLCKLSIFPK